MRHLPRLATLLLWLIASSTHAQSTRVHVVQPGDSLFAIGKKYNVPVATIQAANGITNPSKLRVGQKLIIPVKTAPSPSPPPPLSNPGPAPSPSPVPTRSYVFLDPVKDIIDTPTVIPGRWKYIALHHSATKNGNARIFDIVHRERGMENGMAYHFVIGNGSNSGDGQIEVGRRWLHQLQGGHLAIEELNHNSIGICFVGNYTSDRPTKKQLAAALELISYLRQICGPAPKVRTHTELHPKHTECPGRLFPAAAFHRIFPD